MKNLNNIYSDPSVDASNVDAVIDSATGQDNSDLRDTVMSLYNAEIDLLGVSRGEMRTLLNQFDSTPNLFSYPLSCIGKKAVSLYTEVKNGEKAISDKENEVFTFFNPA
jgi:hypothetical protein